MIDHTIYPDIQRPTKLMKELMAFFAAQPGVYEVLLFGSLADDLGDRWSDVDMIVVTLDYPAQLTVFNRLKQIKPMLYHRPIIHDMGAVVTGCVFEDESVMHTLDLTFFTLAERYATGVLDRFGRVRVLHRMVSVPPGVPAEPATAFTPPEEIDEARLYATIASVRRGLKRHLRGGGVANLGDAILTLSKLLAEYPDDIETVCGNVTELGRRVINLAERVQNQPEEL